MLLNTEILNSEGFSSQEYSPKFRNAKELLNSFDFLEFCKINQESSYDVMEGRWLNILGNENFIFMPGIIVISADSSHMKTWFSQALTFSIIKEHPAYVKEIVHLDFDNGMATYKDRRIEPCYSKEYINENAKFEKDLMSNISENMQSFSKQGLYKYIDHKLLAKYCEAGGVDDISPLDIAKWLAALPEEATQERIFIFDVLSAFESDVNNADKAARFMRILRRLTTKGLGSLSIILHHNNKAKDEKGRSVWQGSNIWLTQSDQLYQLERLSEHDDEIATLSFTKLKNKNDYLNGANGIAFHLHKRKPLEKCLSLANYIEEAEVSELNQRQSLLYTAILELFNDKNELSFKYIIKNLQAEEKDEAWQKSVRRVLTDKLTKGSNARIIAFKRGRENWYRLNINYESPIIGITVKHYYNQGANDDSAAQSILHQLSS